MLSWYYSEVSVQTGPVGSTAANPLVTAITLPDAYVNRIKIRWPEGHNGQTGIYIAKAGKPIIPFSFPAVYFLGNDDEEWFDVGDEMQGNLSANTYNSGKFPHTHYLRIEYVPMAQWIGQSVSVPNLRAI